MDLLGPFPPAKGQRKFIVLAIDYFSKYVEAEALSSITDKQVCQFIWRNIIARYDIPRFIITDNRRQFISKNRWSTAINSIFKYDSTQYLGRKQMDKWSLLIRKS